MQIQLGAAVTLATLVQDKVRAEQLEAGAEETADEIVEVGEPVMTVESEPAETEKLPGVLRLLQEGHFRGVADVRLRIVHADKLAALESKQVRADVTESSESLTSSISTTVAELAEASDSVSGEQADAAIAAFEDQVGAAVEMSFESGAFDAGIVETNLQAAFQNLVDEFELGTSANDLATEGNAESRDFLAELSEIFSVELTKILARAESESMLPPIGEPNGNGRAFEKFLAMYNEIQSVEEPADESSVIEVDA